MYTNFKGVFTALITPFKNNVFDQDAYCKFIEWQISEGVHGLVSCGTTGESTTLTFEEYCLVTKTCVDVVKNRIPTIIGTGSNSTSETIKRTLYAESINASAALIVVPYYNKPTQEGLYCHFKAIHDSTSIPIILYNVPGRCVTDISDETIAKIMELPRIVGIKDATGDLNRPLNLRSLVQKDFFMLSGEDSTALAFNLHGGLGCISVTANVAPKLCSEIQNAFFAQHFNQAMSLNYKLFHLNQLLFCESNPIPIKYALSLIHSYISPELRLPLTLLTEKNQQKITASLKKLNLI